MQKIASEQDAKKHRRNILAVGRIIDLRNYQFQDAVYYFGDKGFAYKIKYCYEYGSMIDIQTDIKEKRLFLEIWLLFL